MFKIIKRFTSWWSRKLCETDENNEEFDYYQYALEGYCCFLLYFIISLIISLFFGYCWYLPFIVFCLLFVREKCGGYHQEKNIYCLINSCLFYFLVGIVSFYLKNLYLIFFFFSFCLFLGLQKIPRYSSMAIKNGLVHPLELQKDFRKTYIIRIIVMTIVNFIFILLDVFLDDFLPNLSNDNFLFLVDFKNLSMIISCSFLVNKFSLSDFAYKIADKLAGEDG